MKYDNIVTSKIISPDGDERKDILFGLACNGTPEDLKQAVKRVVEELQKQEITI